MAADHRRNMTLHEGDRIQCADTTYIITGEPIGYGGTSIVYRARRPDDSLNYVIKECFPREGNFRRINGVIVPSDPADLRSVQLLQTLVQGLYREQRVGQNIHNHAGDQVICIRQLLHPVSITTGGKTHDHVSGSCFALLDQLDQSTISLDDLLSQIAASYSAEDALRTRGLPDIHTTACIMEEVLSVLERVHTAPDRDDPQVHGYYFGDLHGGNVYFSGSRLRDGVVGRARLIDFGSAWELDPQGQTKLLKPGEIFIAPDITPPEINKKNVFRLSRSSDIFSAGCLMVRCVMTPVQLQRYPEFLCTGPNALFPEDCSRISCPPELLEQVNHILDRATSLAPGNRYPNAAQMLQDIRKLKRDSAAAKNQLGLSLSTLGKNTFKGREPELRSLSQAMRDGQNPIILHGFPGIGKTELAIEYGRRKSLHSKVYFVRFAGSFLQTITGPIADAFSGYRKYLHDGTPKSQSTICREVLQLLGQCASSEILIIDDVSCPSGIFAQLRTAEYNSLCALPMRLLLTTRCDPDGIGHWEEVKPMEPLELCRLMGCYVSYPTEQLLPLIAAVDRHTLTVDLMARTMRESRGALTPENLLKSISGSGALPHIGTSRDRSSLRTTLHGHLQKLFDLSSIRGDAHAVMSCALMLPADGMDATLFAQAMTGPVQSTLDRLIRTGWLTITENSLLSIRPVLRQVCHTDLKPDMACCEAFLDRLWDWYRSTPYHAARYTQIANCLAASQLLPRLQNPLHASRSGILYQKAGLYHKALEQATLALDLARQFFPSGSPELAPFYSNLGSVRGSLREYDRQQSCYEMALELLQLDRAVDPRKLADAYCALGSCYGSRGRYDKELEYQQEALRLRKKHLPQNHPDLADSYSRVGGAMSHTQNHQEGLEFLENALRIRERILPPDDPELAASHNNLAAVCYQLQQYQDALEHLKTALGIYLAKLPPNHPELAPVHKNLGILYAHRHDPLASLEHHLQCLQILREFLPADAPQLTEACMDAVNSFCRLTRAEPVRKHAPQLLELLRGIIPEDHPGLIRPYRKMYQAYTHSADRDWQIFCLEKAAQAGDRECMGLLGVMLLRDDRPQEGLLWLERAVRLNDIPSTRILGQLYLGSKVLHRDLKKGLYLLNQAASQSDPEANRLLGQIYLGHSKQTAGRISIDPRLALEYLCKAKSLGATGTAALIREAESLLML